jgi:hypothetical protein
VQRYSNRINTPFLSGDGFESICDYSAFSARTGEVNNPNIKSADSIFCTSDNLEAFIQNSGSEIRAKTLVLGNSDRDFYEFDFELPDSIERVYLQNSHISDDFFQTLPIGLENLRLARNGIPSLFKPLKSNSIKQYKVLVGPFSPSHAERKEIQKWRAIKDKKMTFTEEYLNPNKLSKLSSDYLFIACPRGNGTDTHRFWETLYRGSIPVVKKSNWSISIKKLNIPFVELSNWDYEEFLGVINSQSYIPVNPIAIPELWINHWENLFGLKT